MFKLTKIQSHSVIDKISKMFKVYNNFTRLFIQIKVKRVKKEPANYYLIVVFRFIPFSEEMSQRYIYRVFLDTLLEIVQFQVTKL